MLKLSRFKKGGVHPPGNKDYTKDKAIVNADLPKEVRIPLQQHLGAPAKCIVKEGDEVKEGAIIAEANGLMSANIHSSLQGTVKGIVKNTTGVGFASEMIVIEFEGTFKGEIGKYENRINWQSLEREEILNSIRNAGIVGLGGAAFPSHIKINPPQDKKIEYLIANGAECEPYLTCDHRLMLEKGIEIIEGIKILKKLMRVDKALIGIENNKHDAIHYLDALCQNENGIDIIPLKVNYPQGAEKQLISAALGREVPSGKLPMDVGCVVSNVGTLYAISEAVIYNKPITSRIVTVTGSIVKKPGNYKTRIGTPIRHLLEECGLTESPKKVIMGGPMMGFAQKDLDVPVVKGTSGILVLSQKEAKTYSENPCIRCGSCIRACPMSLMPCNMRELANANLFDELNDIGLFDCIECGSCSYVCPSKIPLVQYFRYGKVMVKNKKKYINHKIPIIPI
ncbi:MAG: electron transport complex subunit RsxC [Spirochaetota bacterium]|nr:electron transport complex subunit RsxC [Spirochaetota bacterium]